MTRVTRSQALVAVTAAALLALAIWGGWVWTHPTLLTDRSDLGNAVFAPRPVADASAQISVGLPGVGADETITIRSAAARFSTNTARATVSFAICRPRDGSVGIIGAVNGSLDQHCAQVRPLRAGTRMRWRYEKLPDYIVMTVTPTRPGTATIDQVTFDYARSARHLWQRGKSRSTVDFVVRAK